MDKELLKEIQNRLLTRRNQLEEELKRYGKREPNASSSWSARYEDIGHSEDENAAEVAMYSDNLSLEKTLEKEYRDVLNALSRIEAGTYGTCRYCDQPILEKRMVARPTSSACIACKEEKKKGTA
ncbi:MAG: TraR/DksA C4-type zinc finger protein [Candidatus Uhrbacteria bacterium]